MAPRAAAAQSFALDADRPSILSAEIQRPLFDAGPGMSAWLGIVAVRYKFSSQTAVLAGLPFAHAAVQADSLSPGVATGPATATTLGNPYVGLRLGLPWQTVAVDLTAGWRVASAPALAYTCASAPPYGCVSTNDPVAQAGEESGFERYEGFARAYSWTVRASAVLSRKLSSAVGLHFRVSGMVIGGGGHTSHGNFAGDLAAAVTYRHGPLVVNGALRRRSAAVLSEAMTDLSVGLGRTVGRTTPMAFAHVLVGNSNPGQPHAALALGLGLIYELSDPAAEP